MKTRTAIIGGVATVATLSAVGIGVATAAPSTTPSSTPSSSASGSPQSDQAKKHDGKHGQGKRALFRRALHGEATLGGAKKQRVVDFQRGTVTAVGTGTITVKSVDGYSATYTTNTQTTVRKDKQKSALADVKVNDRVRVLGTKSGTTVTLKAIGDQGPKK